MLRLVRYCMIAMLVCIGAGSRAFAQLKIDYPNGGERFNPGDTVDVRWSGGCANDTVRIQFSANQGRTWNTITRHATTGSVPWVVPNIPGRGYLMRVVSARFDTGTVRIPLYCESGSSSFNPAGDRVAIAGCDVAVVADAYSGKIIDTLDASICQSYPIPWIRYSPDGRTILLSSCGDGKGFVLLFDAVTFKLIRRLDSADGPCAFSPDGRIVAAKYEGSVGLWDVATGAFIRSTKGPSQSILDIDYSPDGKTVVASDGGGGVTAYDVATGAFLKAYHGLEVYYGDDYAYTIAYNADGSRLVGGNYRNGYTCVWNAKTGDLLFRKSVDIIPDANFNAAGDYIVTGSYHDTLYIYDAATFELVRTIVGNAYNPYLIWGASFSPDGRRILRSGDGVLPWIFNFETIVDSDASDAAWSVAPLKVDVMNGDAGRCLVKRWKSVQTSFTNRSTQPIRLLDVKIDNQSDTSAFTLPNNLAFPFILLPGKTLVLVFGFNPRDTGLYTGRVNLITESSMLSTDDDTIRASIRGVGVGPSVRVDTSIVNFGVVPAGDVRYINVPAMFTNIDRVPLVITTTIEPGAITIVEGGGTFTLQPGESHAMQFRYAPVVEGYSGHNVMLRHEGLDAPNVIQVVGTCKGGALDVDEAREPVRDMALRAVPDPATMTTTVEYMTPSTTHLRLMLLNVMGVRVASLVDEMVQAGRHSVSVDVSSLPSGIYFYLLESSSQRISRAVRIGH